MISDYSKRQFNNKINEIFLRLFNKLKERSFIKNDDFVLGNFEFKKKDDIYLFYYNKTRIEFIDDVELSIKEHLINLIESLNMYYLIKIFE